MNKRDDRFAFSRGENVLAMYLTQAHRRERSVTTSHNQNEIITAINQRLDDRQQRITFCSSTVQSGGNQATSQHGRHQRLARSPHIGKRGADKGLIAFVGCRAHPDHDLILCNSGPLGSVGGWLLKRLTAPITSQPGSLKAQHTPDMDI